MTSPSRLVEETASSVTFCDIALRAHVAAQRRLLQGWQEPGRPPRLASRVNAFHHRIEKDRRIRPSIVYDINEATH